MNKKLKAVNLIAAVLLITVLAFGFSGCEKDSAGSQAEAAETTVAAETTAAPETTEAAEEQVPLEVVDGMGNTISIDNPAETVIIFSPAVLEIFAGLDAMDKVAEVDSWSVQMGDPLAEGFSGAGDVNGLNFETITKINPDLVIVVGFGPEEDYKKLEASGFKVYRSNSFTIEGTYSEIENIGKLIGKPDEGISLAQQLKEEVEIMKDKVKDISKEDLPKVFYMVWNDPIMSAGNNTFINELIEVAGGLNIVAEDGLTDWPEYSIEKIIKNDPDIIIAPFSLAMTPDIILDDSKFSTIKAVINNKVYCVPDNPLTRPNQNIIKGLKMLSSAFHPEIFGEFAVVE